MILYNINYSLLTHGVIVFVKCKGAHKHTKQYLSTFKVILRDFRKTKRKKLHTITL